MCWGTVEMTSLHVLKMKRQKEAERASELCLFRELIGRVFQALRVDDTIGQEATPSCFDEAREAQPAPFLMPFLSDVKCPARGDRGCPAAKSNIPPPSPLRLSAESAGPSTWSRLRMSNANTRWSAGSVH